MIFQELITQLVRFLNTLDDNSDNFSLVAGARVDNHNRLGTFVTPRLHIRYNPWKKLLLELQPEEEKRAANILLKTNNYLHPNRNFSILNTDGNYMD